MNDNPPNIGGEKPSRAISKLGLATKIAYSLVIILSSLWYQSYIAGEHYEFAGYENFSELLFTGHIPVLALVPDALRGAKDFYDECSSGACGDEL